MLLEKVERTKFQNPRVWMIAAGWVPRYVQFVVPGPQALPHLILGIVSVGVILFALL